MILPWITPPARSAAWAWVQFDVMTLEYAQRN